MKLYTTSLLLIAGIALSNLSNAQTSWENVGTTNDTMVLAGFIDLAFHPTSDDIFVSYDQIIFGNAAIVSKYDGTDWGFLGAKHFTGNRALYQNIEFNPDTKNLYMAYADDGLSLKASVMMYNGSSWTAVGSKGFSSDTILGISLAFHPTTYQPYVGFMSYGDGNTMSVMKYDGSSWSYVGGKGFSVSTGGVPVLTFDPNSGDPYFAYFDNAVGASRVKTFDGTNWVDVGSSFSAGALILDMEFDPSGDVYVFYMDAASGNKATVASFDGSNWNSVGSALFSEGGISNPALAPSEALAFNSNGQPYVAFVDDLDNDNNTEDSLVVMTFSGSSWTKVGNALTSSSGVGFSLGISDADVPHIAYSTEEENYKIYVKSFGDPVMQTAPTAPSNLSLTQKKKQFFDKIQLDWTDNSDNEDGFVIERSTDGNAWSNHDSVAENITTYLDTGLSENQTYYYRVFAFNAIGNSTASNSESQNTGIASISTVYANVFSVFPNPVLGNKTLNIRYASIEESAHTIYLYSCDGKLVLVNPLQPKLDLTEMASGFYMLEIQSNQGSFRTKIRIQ